MMLLASFPETSTTVAQFQFLRMFELIWSENCLRLCVSDLAFPLADASTQIELYLSTRMEQRKAWGRIYGPGEFSCPCLATSPLKSCVREPPIRHC